jgi:hypothetical protein
MLRRCRHWSGTGRKGTWVMVPLHIHSVLEDKSVDKLDLSGVMWRSEGGRGLQRGDFILY